MSTKFKVFVGSLAVILASTTAYLYTSGYFSTNVKLANKLAEELTTAVKDQAKLAGEQLSSQDEEQLKAFVNCFAAKTVDALDKVDCKLKLNKTLAPQIDRCVLENPSLVADLQILTMSCAFEASKLE